MEAVVLNVAGNVAVAAGNVAVAAAAAARRRSNEFVRFITPKKWFNNLYELRTSKNEIAWLKSMYLQVEKKLRTSIKQNKKLKNKHQQALQKEKNKYRQMLKEESNRYLEALEKEENKHQQALQKEENKHRQMLKEDSNRYLEALQKEKNKHQQALQKEKNKYQGHSTTTIRRATTSRQLKRSHGRNKDLLQAIDIEKGNVEHNVAQLYFNLNKFKSEVKRLQKQIYETYKQLRPEFDPFTVACMKGILEDVKMMIEHDPAEVNAKKYESTRLHTAACHGHTEVAKLLLRKGADIHATNKDGKTPLHIAAVEGQTKVAELLLREGANIHAKDKKRFTPLSWAAENGHTKVADLLLRAGAEVDVRDENTWTPLYRAANKGHDEVAELLLREGAKVNANGWTPLHSAAQNGHTKVADLLLREGANIHAKSYCGKTPLHLAAYREWCTEVAKLLLREGAEVNAKDKDGKTPLHLAAEDRKVEMHKLLIAHGGKLPLYLILFDNAMKFVGSGLVVYFSWLLYRLLYRFVDIYWVSFGIGLRNFGIMLLYWVPLYLIFLLGFGLFMLLWEWRGRQTPSGRLTGPRASLLIAVTVCNTLYICYICFKYVYPWLGMGRLMNYIYG